MSLLFNTLSRLVVAFLSRSLIVFYLVTLILPTGPSKEFQMSTTFGEDAGEGQVHMRKESEKRKGSDV